ncbi:MAG: HU family DNA-binding protein [Leptospirales bacterium]
MAKAAKATLTKSDLIDALHSKNGTLTKKAVAEVVDQLFSTVTEQVAKGSSVNIVGFGKFHAVKRAARMGRNPATGATIKIAATTSPRFSAGKAFKDAVGRKK